MIKSRGKSAFFWERDFWGAAEVAAEKIAVDPAKESELCFRRCEHGWEVETDLANELTKGIIMGAMAEAIVEYARPLIDETDGSPEALQRAMDFAMMCWNLAMFPEGKRKEALQEALRGLTQENPGEEDGIAGLEEIVLNMIQRHEDMFPLMHSRKRGGLPFDQDELPASLTGNDIIHLASDEFSDDEYESEEQTFEYVPAHHAAGNQRDPRGAGRNDPCPCGSGRKFKHCCRRT